MLDDGSSCVSWERIAQDVTVMADISLLLIKAKEFLG